MHQFQATVAACSFEAVTFYRHRSVPTVSPRMRLLAVLLIAISLLDLRSRRIPDALTATVAACGFARSAAADGPAPAALTALALLGLLILAAFLADRATARHGRVPIGGGDLKLAAALGLWTGLTGLAPMLTLAALLALAAAGTARLAGMPVDRRTQIPFGPFLALAGFIVFWIRSSWPATWALVF